MKNPACAAGELADLVPGPDFPTGGVLVEPPEELDGLVVPGPADVIRDLAQRLNARREAGNDAEAANGFHDGLTGQSYAPGWLRYNRQADCSDENG